MRFTNNTYLLFLNYHDWQYNDHNRIRLITDRDSSVYARGASLAPRAASPPPRDTTRVPRAILEAGRVTAGGGRHVTRARDAEILRMSKNVTLLWDQIGQHETLRFKIFYFQKLLVFSSFVWLHENNKLQLR